MADLQTLLVWQKVEGYASFRFNFYRSCLGSFSLKVHLLLWYVSYWKNFSQRIKSKIYNHLFLRSFSSHCLKNAFNRDKEGRYKILLFQSHFGNERIVKKVDVKKTRQGVRLFFPFCGKLGMNPPPADL